MLIILEGLDRTGKSSVAKYYKDNGYEPLHMSAPPKEMSQPGYVGPSYLDQMVDLLQMATTRNIVLDRSHYGELIWPQVYGRKALLNEDDYEILRELEDTVGCERILMHDPNVEAHWNRCVENKEPLTKAQFLKARQLYDRMAEKYAFTRKTLKDFDIEPVQRNPSVNTAAPTGNSSVETGPQGNPTSSISDQIANMGRVSPEQSKLEKANAINDVLSKKILKSKGQVYDELESDIQNFLKDKLGRIFGDTPESLSKEEVKYLKLLVKQIKAKESK